MVGKGGLPPLFLVLVYRESGGKPPFPTASLRMVIAVFSSVVESLQRVISLSHVTELFLGRHGIAGTEMAGKNLVSDVIRTFICIEIPESVKERIDALQTTLKEIDAQVSWTKPSNIHLTLKFLGSVETPRIDRVRKAVQRAAAGISPFEIEVSGTGCFPSPRNPRVLWVGFSVVPEALKQLYTNIEDELAREGFPREKRKFSPHLTMGRIRTQHNSTLVAEALIATGFTPQSFDATEVIVMRSDLKPTGSIYTRQAWIGLD